MTHCYVHENIVVQGLVDVNLIRSM